MCALRGRSRLLLCTLAGGLAAAALLTAARAAQTPETARPAPGAVDVSAHLKGNADESAAFQTLVREHRHVRIPAGFALTIDRAILVPPDTLIEGPGTIHLAAQGASLVLDERCTVRDLRFTCANAFAHGAAITMAATRQGEVRRMDSCITGCRFEKMRGHALRAVEVAHIAFERNQWENHSDSAQYYNATLLMAVHQSRFRDNTVLHPNQGLLFRGGSCNTVTGNYIENCLQGISCHTTGAHPRHWPYTLFAHNVIANNVIKRHREEGITYDNSMGETPAVNAAQNQVRAVATVKAVQAADRNRFRVVINEPANPDKAYAQGWADGYYVGVLTGEAAATLLEVIDSGVDGEAWIDLPRPAEQLPGRLRPGDRLWIAAGCFYNVIADNVIDNTGMVSGHGNATCVGLWGAAWYNRIAGNICTTRQYGITLGCVGLQPPNSPQGPSAGNVITQNTIAASWRNKTTTLEDKSLGAIANVYIGEGQLLDGRMFLGNQITHNIISWAGGPALRLARDHGSWLAFNQVSGQAAPIAMDHTTNAILEGNRSVDGTVIRRTSETGPCSYRVLDPGSAVSPAPK